MSHEQIREGRRLSLVYLGEFALEWAGAEPFSYRIISHFLSREAVCKIVEEPPSSDAQAPYVYDDAVEIKKALKPPHDRPTVLIKAVAPHSTWPCLSIQPRDPGTDFYDVSPFRPLSPEAAWLCITSVVHGIKLAHSIRTSDQLGEVE